MSSVHSPTRGSRPGQLGADGWILWSLGAVTALLLISVAILFGRVDPPVTVASAADRAAMEARVIADSLPAASPPAKAAEPAAGSDEPPSAPLRVALGATAAAADRTTGHVLRPDGTPAAGCEIVICDCSEARAEPIRALDADELEEMMPPDAVLSATDASGGFALPTTGERYVIQARLPDHAWQFLTFKPGDELAPIQLSAAKKLHGRVLDEAGRPLRAARVLRFQWYLRTDLDAKPLAEVLRLCGFQETVFTDLDGRFAFSHTNDVAQQVVCRADGYAEARTHVLDPDDEVLIKCLPPATLFGRVEDTSGAPVFEARVEPWTWGSIPNVGGKFVRTDAQGCYTLDGALSGCLLVGAWAPGYGYVPKIVSAPAGSRTRVDLVIPKEDQITGLVHDLQERPVAGVKIRPLNIATGISLAVATTDDQGAFALKLIAPGAPYELHLTKEGWREESVRVIRGGERDRVLTIRRLGNLVLAPRSEDGVPIAEVKLRLYAREDPSMLPWAEYFHVERPSRVVAVKDGLARVEGLWPSTYTVEVRAPDHATVLLERIQLGEGDMTPIQVPMRSGVELEGQVIDGAGAPVAGARVSRMDEFHDGRAILGCEAESALTGGDGRFRLRCSAGASVSLAAQKEGFAPAHALGLRASERPGVMPTLVLTRGGTVVGAIRSRYPRADECYVMKMYPIGVAMPIKASVDAQGRFQVNGVPAGWVDVEAEDQQMAYIFGNYPHEKRRVLVKEDETTTVSFDTTGSLMLRGTIRGLARSLLLELYRLEGDAEAGLVTADYTRCDGSFEMRSLSPGRYRLEANPIESGYAVVLRRDVQLEREVEEVTIDVARDHLVAMVVAPESGAPVADAHVVVCGSDGAERARARTDATGMIDIVGVPEGASLVVGAAGRATLVRRAAIAPEPERILLPLEGVLQLEIADDLGAPVRGAQVVVRGGDGAGARETMARADGVAVIRSLEPATWRATASQRWYRTAHQDGLVTSAGETTSARLTLVRLGVLEVSVRLPNGLPGRGVPIVLVPNSEHNDAELPPGSPVTGDDGRLRLELPVDTYAVFAGPDQQVEARASVEHGRVVPVELEVAMP